MVAQTKGSERVCLTVLLFLLVPLLSLKARAFKHEDFKLCRDSAFCTRLRQNTNQGADYVVEPSSVQVHLHNVTARVVNKSVPGVSYVLTLTTYDGPVVRMHMKEEGAFRYEVPEVVLDELESKTAPFKLLKKSSSILKVQLGDYTFALKYNPMRLDVSENVWETLMSFNADKLFAMEHHRERGDSDPENWWSERFKTHTDEKARGPEAISFDISFPTHREVYGLPERATSLALKPTVDARGAPVAEPYRLYNLDVFEYLAESNFGLYGSIPFMYAHNFGHTMGVFWLNAAEMYVDVAKEKNKDGVKTQWMAESGVLDVFFMMGPTPKDVSTQYAMITGGTALPQLFSLGYHQCRWNYKDEQDVKQVDAGFDTHGIPYDVLWLDIEHTNDKRYFTWDERYFPTPAEMQADLASRGRKMVTIVDPHIKKDDGWDVFTEARDQNLFVKKATGVGEGQTLTDFEGWCWPGASYYPDWLLPEARAWWAGRFAFDKYVGSTKSLFQWNDMNEPSVFNGPELTMHKHLRHAGGAEHRDVHNIYGLFFHMATAEGQKQRLSSDVDEQERPFVLSRAFFSGTQRVGPIWTGDNGADWDHLAVSVPMVVSIGLAGLPFNGADVGGFFGNPDAELMTRWYQLGAYYPFFRGHAHLESSRREPWLFGEDATRRIRNAIQERYRILPYMYTQFLHANVSGTPILRPIWYEFPQAEGISHREHIFMVGSSMLVAPVLHKGQTQVTVSLPEDTVWYDMKNGRVVSPGNVDFKAFVEPCTLDDGVKSYLKGGSMLPTKERRRRSTEAMQDDPYTLYVALSIYQKSEGDLYMDDGRSYAFQKGQYVYKRFEFDDYVLTSKSVQLPEMADADPSYRPENRIERIVVLGFAGGPKGWRASMNVDGKKIELDAAPGKMYVGEHGGDVALVIRSPPINAADDFEIAFSKVEQ